MKVHIVTIPALLCSGAYALPSKTSCSGCEVTAAWPGWNGIKYAFIFGDSYTSTSFNYTLTPAPSPSDPLGNPPYPGWTSSNGPNWVGFLTTQYNASLLQTYNLAYGGATVDSDLVQPYLPTVLSVKQQVHDEFVPGYVNKTAPSAPDWAGNDTLFAVWIGINDVGNSYWKAADERAALYDDIFAVYAEAVDTLYETGGRNFVFVNVPPVDRSPLMLAQDEAARVLEQTALADFNARIGAMATALKAGHAGDVNVWTFNASALFTAVLGDPLSYPQTAGYKNTTAYCEAYENGTPEWTTFNETCGIPVNEYFWLNSLHPTYPMHDVVAQQLARELRAGPNVCGH